MAGDTFEVISSYILVVLITLLIGSLALALAGAFDSPMDRLGIDMDSLVGNHVIKYYPEYENHTFRFTYYPTGCEPGIYGVEVYYNNMNNRDGLVVASGELEATLCLEDITPEEILYNILEENNIKFNAPLIQQKEVHDEAL